MLKWNAALFEHPMEDTNSVLSLRTLRLLPRIGAQRLTGSNDTIKGARLFITVRGKRT